MWIFVLIGIIAGFAFPAFLISALKADEENRPVPAFMSCVTFGVVVAVVLISLM